MTFDRLRQYGDITSIRFELEESDIKEGQSFCTGFYNYYVNWIGDK